jgi:peptidoglycan/xylan/chitin deacetylase (PgdA/CDA1 family)
MWIFPFLPDSMSIVKRAYAKLIRESDDTIRQLAGTTGFYNQFYKNARGCRILLYHGICQSDHTRFNPIFLKQRTLESHLRFYKEHFNLVSLDDVFHKRLADDKFNICLSFDDGYANNYKYVLPLLQQYKVPAAFFVTGIRDAGYDILWNDFLNIATKYGPETLRYKNDAYSRNRFGRYVSSTNREALADQLRASDFTGKKEMMQLLSPLVDFKNDAADLDYWQQMNESQIRELSASPFATIGCHGYYHNDLAKIPLQQAKEEMIRARKYLEIITGKEIKSLAFPYGSYTREVKEEAQNAGYSQLLAADYLLPADEKDTTIRQRFTINPFIHVHTQMQAIIKGDYAHWK